MPTGCGNTMSEFERLLKENILNPRAQEIGDTWIKNSENEGNHGYKAHDKVFGEENNHLVIPVQKSSYAGMRKVDHEKIPEEVKTTLTKHGYGIHDYVGNVAIRNRINIHGNPQEERSSISKVLAREKDGKALAAYNNDKNRANATSGDHEIVISRSPQDLLRMTSSRRWSGAHCTRMPGPEVVHPELTKHISSDEMEKGGLFHHTIESDIKHGTLIAYLVKKGDHAVENPLARVLLKKHYAYDSTGNSLGSDRDIWKPETGHDFGHPTDDFKNTVEEWSHRNYPRIMKGEKSVEFRKEKELYDDDISRFVHNKAGVDEKPDRVSHYNEFGKLHDHPDGTAAVVADRYAETTHIHYKNGMMHRDDDKPALSTFDHTRGKVTEEVWMKNGMTHREGDKPAVITSTGNRTVKIYSKYGMQHRETSLGPAESSETHYRYQMNGELHRPVSEGPASHNKDGDFAYMEYGSAKRPPTGGPSNKSMNQITWAGSSTEPHVRFHSNREIISLDHPNGDREIINRKLGTHIKTSATEDVEVNDIGEEAHNTYNKYEALSKIVPEFTPHK